MYSTLIKTFRSKNNMPATAWITHEKHFENLCGADEFFRASMSRPDVIIQIVQTK